MRRAAAAVNNFKEAARQSTIAKVGARGGCDSVFRARVDSQCVQD